MYFLCFFFGALTRMFIAVSGCHFFRGHVFGSFSGERCVAYDWHRALDVERVHLSWRWPKTLVGWQATLHWRWPRTLGGWQATLHWRWPRTLGGWQATLHWRWPRTLGGWQATLHWHWPRTLGGWQATLHWHWPRTLGGWQTTFHWHWLRTLGGWQATLHWCWPRTLGVWQSLINVNWHTWISDIKLLDQLVAPPVSTFCGRLINLFMISPTASATISPKTAQFPPALCCTTAAIHSTVRFSWLAGSWMGCPCMVFGVQTSLILR